MQRFYMLKILRLSDESLTLLDVLLQVRQTGFQQFLLFRGDWADGVDLLDTIDLL